MSSFRLSRNSGSLISGQNFDLQLAGQLRLAEA
jgi:hypothetical protein